MWELMPLYATAIYGDEAVVRMLLEEGANVDKGQCEAMLPHKAATKG